MLVLSRRQGETIWIGDRVRVTVLKLDRNGVRLGIEAPGDMSILREELIRPAGDRAAWDGVGEAPLAVGVSRA
jgi:carbon storage regulator